MRSPSPRPLRSRLAAALLAAVAAASSHASAASFVVDTTSDTVDAAAGDGVCADATAACSLRAAVMEANALGGAHDLTVPAGTYVLTIPPAPVVMFENFDPEVGDLDIACDLTLTGATRDTTILDGNQQTRIFKLTDRRDLDTGAVLESGRLTLSQVTLQNGLGTVSNVFGFGANGGAIRASPLESTGGTPLALSHVLVRDSTSPAFGGGIMTNVPTALTDVVITGNTARSTGSVDANGGGLALGIFAGPTVLTRVTITGNVAQNTTNQSDAVGGGINNVALDGLYVVDSEISGNTAVSLRNGEGGGIYSNGSLMLQNVRVENNEAINGAASAAFAGGIENAGGSVVIIGGTLKNNCAARDHATCVSRSPGGSGSGEGGALVNSGCKSENCQVAGEGKALLFDVVIEHNFAQSNGGAISNRNKGTVTMDRVLLFDNAASNGGGLYTRDSESQVTITGSTIDGNTGVAFGGGIYNSAALTIGTSTISNNGVSTGRGGGIESCDGTSLTITNTTISGNQAAGNTGGLCAGDATDLSFVTIAGNTAGGGPGGGLFVPSAASPVRMRGVLLADNTSATVGPDCFTQAPLTSLGANLIENASDCTVTATTGDQFGTAGSPIDPLLGLLQANGGATETQALGNGSVAIDAVAAGICTDTSGAVVPNDQRGFTRPAGAACDVGASERDAVEPPATPRPTPSATPRGSATPGGGATTTPTASATPPTGGADGYRCYGTRPVKGSAAFAPGAGVHVLDDFRDVLVALKKPRALCAPLVPANDVATHLALYATKAVKGQPKFVKQAGVSVSNALGTVLLDLTKPDALLVRAATSTVSAPPAPDLDPVEVDDYQCYKAKIAKGAPKFPTNLEITATDALTNVASRFLVKKPRVLCAPASVDGESTHRAAYQLCYGVKLAAKRCADGAPTNAGAACKQETDCGGTKKVTAFCVKQPKAAGRSGIFTADRFAAAQVDAPKAAELCLPTERGP